MVIIYVAPKKKKEKKRNIKLIAYSTSGFMNKLHTTDSECPLGSVEKRMPPIVIHLQILLDKLRNRNANTDKLFDIQYNHFLFERIQYAFKGKTNANAKFPQQ